LLDPLSDRERVERKPTAREARSTTVIAGLLFLSGAAGPIYQVAWVRLLGLAFGVTVYAISSVLAAFMGGLAIGSFFGGRRTDMVRRPLRVYGLVELHAYVGQGPILTDDHPILEYFQAQPISSDAPDLSRFSGQSSSITDN
jgi:hypothetical protein